MKLAAFVFLAFILSFFGWRFASKKHEIPCPSWLGWLVELDNPIFRNVSAASIVQNSNAREGMRVLDYGCGTGRLTIPLAMALTHGSVTACDIQDGMLKKVEQKAKKEELINIDFINVSKTPDAILGQKYDKIYLSAVLGEIIDQVYILSMLREALSDEGELFVSETIADPHFISRTKLKFLAAEAGFVERRFFGFSFAYSSSFQKIAKEAAV